MAGYKTFVAGEEALAADVNGFLMSQTVPRFTNAAARTSALTSPAINQLSMLDTRPGIVQYWNGSVWADASYFTQPGHTNVTTTGASTPAPATITFPVAFASAPTVTCTPDGFGGSAQVVVAITAITTTGFTVIMSAGAGNIGPGFGIGIYWIAVGLKP